MQKTMQKNGAKKGAKKMQKNDAKNDAKKRGKKTMRSQWWASSRAQPTGSPLADRPTIQRCGALLVIEWPGACTQPAHRIPSRRPHPRAVAWRQGVIGWLTLGARVRRNPAGFRGVLSWSTGL